MRSSSNSSSVNSWIRVFVRLVFAIMCFSPSLLGSTPCGELIDDLLESSSQIEALPEAARDQIKARFVGLCSKDNTLDNTVKFCREITELNDSAKQVLFEKTAQALHSLDSVSEEATSSFVKAVNNEVLYASGVGFANPTEMMDLVGFVANHLKETGATSSAIGPIFSKMRKANQASDAQGFKSLFEAMGDDIRNVDGIIVDSIEKQSGAITFGSQVIKGADADYVYYVQVGSSRIYRAVQVKSGVKSINKFFAEIGTRGKTYQEVFASGKTFQLSIPVGKFDEAIENLDVKGMAEVLALAKKREIVSSDWVWGGAEEKLAKGRELYNGLLNYYNIAKVEF